MSVRVQFKQDRHAVAMLATAVVLIGGLACCIAILLVFAEEGRLLPLAIAIGTTLVLAGLCWMFRDRPEAEKKGWFSWVMNRNARPQHIVYQPRKSGQATQYGTQAPPTLEEVKAMKESLNTWVPSNKRLPGER